jgi:hypothetical protein
VNIQQFEHVVRASAAITGETVFVVVGSQAVLAQHPRLPQSMAQSVELDIYPRFRPELAEVIEGAIGADSPFHGTFGYHADGIGPDTARLPQDWETRAFEFAVGDARAICPEIHDIAVSKLLAGRPKDLQWLEAAVQASLVDTARVTTLLGLVQVTADEWELAHARLARLGGG